MARSGPERRSRAQESIQRRTDHRHPEGGGGRDSTRRTVPAARDHTREPVPLEGEVRRDGSERGAATAATRGGKPAAEARRGRAAAGQTSLAGGGHKKVVGPQMPASSAVPASAAVPVSPPRTIGTPVYGSQRSPRASAGSLAADSRTVAGSPPVRASAPANADLRPFAADTGMSPDVPSLARRRVAPKPRLPSASLPPPVSASAGLPLFCDHRLQGSFVQQQLGHDVLQLPVFLLQLPQSPRLAHFHSAV